MGLRDLFTRDAYSIRNKAVNERPRAIATMTGLMPHLGKLKYSDAYLWMIFRKIFDGLANVQYVVETRDNGYDKLERVAASLTSNIKTIVWLWWNYGYVIINKEKDGRFTFPDYSKLRKDKQNNIILEKWQVAIYSDSYIFSRRSDIEILANDVLILDIFKNGLDYLTRSLGALGILSAKDLPMTEEDKDDFNKKLKEKYGITQEQFQIILSSTPMDFKQMVLPIKDLALDERIKDEVKILAGYFGVPYDLLPISGQSTYANQEQAIRQFYSNCISPLAEIGLALGRQMVKEDRGLLIKSDKLTFRIDNVPELEDDRTASVEYKLKVAELTAKLREQGLDTTEYDEQLTTL